MISDSPNRKSFFYEGQVKLLLEIFLFALFLFKISPQAFCDESQVDSILYGIETKATFSQGQNTPFWMVSNLYGLGTPELNNGYVRGEIVKPLSSEKKISWGAGIDLVGGWNLPGAFRIQQLYAELKYKKLWINVGSREFKSEYNLHNLSSGDLLFSGNALPIPQFRVGTYGYAPVWGTNEWFSVKAYLAYGIFTDSNWQKSWVKDGTRRTANVLFCGRELMFKIGNQKKFPLSGEFGIEMGTQFGGKSYNNGQIIRMPTKFVDWIKAIIPLAGSAKTPLDEQTNIQGNMAGEYKIGLDYSPKPDWNIKLYYEHYFEDHSQMFLEYGLWKDGLWGIELSLPKNPFLEKFVYEFVTTKDQTGAVLHNSTPSIPEQVSGQDGYFDHYIYGAWQNWGLTMGTPLAISPLYNRDHLNYLFDTRFSANHFGIQGAPHPDVKWRALFSFSQNWGTYFRPLKTRLDDFSGILEMEYNPSFFKSFFIRGAFAWDTGNLLGNNLGGYISIGLSGGFGLKKKL